MRRPAIGETMIVYESVDLVIHGEPLLTPAVGIGVYTSRLIRGLLRRAPDLQLRVIADESLRGALPWIPERSIIWSKSSRLPFHPILRQVARANTAAAIVARRFPRAVFHCPAPFWSRHRPPRTVVTMHDCIYRHFPAYLGRLPLRRWHALKCESFAAQCPMVITDSDYSAVDLARNTAIRASRINVVPLWVEDEFISAARDAHAIERVRRKFGLPARFWLYVGGFDYRKNVERLIESYSMACREVSCPKLVLAGAIPAATRPPYSDVRSAIARYKIPSDSIVITGAVDPGELAPLYGAAELFIYPSLYEGFGLPPLEAMAADTPVLVSDRTSLPELVTRDECRFDPSLAEPLASKLCAAADNPERFRCPPANRFTEGVAITSYLNVISKVTNTGLEP